MRSDGSDGPLGRKEGAASSVLAPSSDALVILMICIVLLYFLRVLLIEATKACWSSRGFGCVNGKAHGHGPAPWSKMGHMAEAIALGLEAIPLRLETHGSHEWSFLGSSV